MAAQPPHDVGGEEAGPGPGSPPPQHRPGPPSRSGRSASTSPWRCTSRRSASRRSVPRASSSPSPAPSAPRPASSTRPSCTGRSVADESVTARARFVFGSVHACSSFVLSRSKALLVCHSRRRRCGQANSPFQIFYLNSFMQVLNQVVS